MSMSLKNVLVWVVIVAGSALSSWHIAVGVEGTDFPVFYMAAKRFVDSSTPIEAIFQTSMDGLDILPERHLRGNYFIYSPVIAMLFSPLAFLPYFIAKSAMMFINIMAYFAANLLVLKMLGHCTWRYFIYSILFLWMPFVTNFCAAQVNALILILIIAALLQIVRQKPLVAGSILGLAALFKIFPLAIAVLSGTFHRKITIAGFAVFTLALMVPGSQYWLEAMPTVSTGHTPVFLFLNSYGLQWFFCYSATIVILSLLLLLRVKTNDPLVMMAYALPAALAAMPIVQYHHLILLSATYSIFFLSEFPFRSKQLYVCLMAGTLIHINLNGLFETIPSSYWSVLAIWGTLSLSLFSATTPLPHPAPAN